MEFDLSFHKQNFLFKKGKAEMIIILPVFAQLIWS